MSLSCSSIDRTRYSIHRIDVFSGTNELLKTITRINPIETGDTVMCNQQHNAGSTEETFLVTFSNNYEAFVICMHV